MRKANLLQEIWNEYIQAFSKFIPKPIRDRFFTRKAVYITAAIISIEFLAALAVYWFWFKS